MLLVLFESVDFLLIVMKKWGFLVLFLVTNYLFLVYLNIGDLVSSIDVYKNFSPIVGFCFS